MNLNKEIVRAIFGAIVMMIGMSAFVGLDYFEAQRNLGQNGENTEIALEVEPTPIGTPTSVVTPEPTPEPTVEPTPEPTVTPSVIPVIEDEESVETLLTLNHTAYLLETDSPQGEIIKRCYPEDEVVLIERGDSYYLVRVGEDEGYINKRYIDDPEEMQNEETPLPDEVQDEPVEEVSEPTEEWQDPQEPTGSTWTGARLNPVAGVVYGPVGKETFYDLDMSGVVGIMRGMGFDEASYPYWVRDDGAKMLGDYVMVAADLNTYPRGSLVESSLGTAMVCDTGGFVSNGSGVVLDVATNWGS